MAECFSLLLAIERWNLVCADISDPYKNLDVCLVNEGEKSEVINISPPWNYKVVSAF